MSPSPTTVPPTSSVHAYEHDGAPVEPPAHATVIATLLERARTTPDRACVTWVPEEGAPRVLTYGELERRSRALADALLRRQAPGETVALLPGNDLPSVTAVFATLRAATPCLFLDPGDPEHRLRAVLREHPAATVLCSPFAGEHARGLADLVLNDAPDTVAGPPLPGDGTVPAEDPAFLFGTSGSTAASKLVVQPHRALTSNAEAVRRHHGLDGATTLLGGLPIHHVNGVHFTLVAVVHSGAHVVLPQRISPFGHRALIDAHRPHIVSLVPPVLQMLLATGRGWRPPGGLRHFVSAAAPLPAALAREVLETFGVRVLQGYGLSETTNFSTTMPTGLPDAVYRTVTLDVDIPSVGVALPGNEVEVFTPDGTLLGEGRTGEIRMRGHNVMSGYAGRPDLTADAFAGGWFHSGDLGHWRTGPDGLRYFHLTGRDKNMAKVRGESVSLEEVERALVSLPGVADAACLSVPHPAWGEQLVALVAAPHRDLRAIREELAALVPVAALPTGWQQLDRIPRTATGKLRRPRLAELYGAGEGP
ncbi:class I adenylate-forming enzyme family protein [Streptomyces avermitilis]|uniref:class I adenylate-forming enzyme family protein n=1 Tax=Streptomyces avermitilis TaxID=33903 RepID=UPI0033B945BB